MIKSITQVDYREYDRQTGNWDWSYYYRVEYENGEIIETHAWHPNFAGHEIKVVKE